MKLVEDCVIYKTNKEQPHIKTKNAQHLNLGHGMSTSLNPNLLLLSLNKNLGVHTKDSHENAQDTHDPTPNCNCHIIVFCINLKKIENISLFHITMLQILLVSHLIFFRYFYKLLYI